MNTARPPLDSPGPQRAGVGTLTAQEQAEVAAETSGRIVATPVERGSRVGGGGEVCCEA